MSSASGNEVAGAMWYWLSALAIALFLSGCAAPVVVSGRTESPASPSHHQRSPGLKNTINTRDLGGYVGAEGRRVKWGLLYRSDSLAQLDDADLEILKGLQLTTVTDLRSPSERQLAPDRLPQQSPALKVETLAINNPAVDIADLGKRFYAGEVSAAELRKFLDRRPYIEDPVLRSRWGAWVRSLAEPGALPQIFHCTMGKDRTGFAAAIVLLTLGVSKADVMSDFLLSNLYLEDKIEQWLPHIQARSSPDVEPELLRQVLGVSRYSLESAFAAMEAQYGSVEGYIEQGLGIDAGTRSRLRSLLLE